MWGSGGGARSRALELGLTGHATNKSDGRVHVVAEGPEQACRDLLALLRGADTPGTVEVVVDSWEAARGGIAGFVER